MYHNVLQRTTKYYNVLQCTTKYYNVLQHITTHYNGLQRTVLNDCEPQQTAARLAQGSRKARASKYLLQPVREHRLRTRLGTYTYACVDICGYVCAFVLCKRNSRKELAQGTCARACARNLRKQARASTRLFDFFFIIYSIYI